MNIKVTQKHIDEGLRWNCSYCPIALAIKELLKVAVVSVNARTVYFPFDIKSEKLPLNISTFIKRFDAGCIVYPIEFELEIPHENIY